MPDYTKHKVGQYACTVVDHKIGERNADDYLELNANIDGLNYADGVDTSAPGTGDRITASIKISADQWWKLTAMLTALGYKGKSLDPIYNDQVMFSGVQIVLECSHYENKKNGNINEYWNLPGRNALAPLRPEKKQLWNQLFAESVAKQEEQGGAITDADVPF